MTRSSDDIEIRLLLPRDALSSANRPEYFSQRNCESLGLSRREFLDLLRRADAPPVTHLGKRRLVRSDLLLAYLDRVAVRADTVATTGALDGPDRVLRDLGCTPVRRTRRVSI